ncbi:MAG TPA: LysM peptidoglycan-binding domain-containing protein [Thermodesulfobacteriota bacterium]|nr:LysM peptidoglycan-binding domain-containing protein [Thermodesulfobacteriota bacterium]
MFYKYLLPVAGALTLLLAGCGAKSPTRSASGPTISGIHLGDKELNSEIKIVDEDNGDESVDDVRSSFFILNPQVQGWKTYYYLENIFDQFPDVAPETEKEIPVVLNDRVIHYMVYFQNQGRRSFSTWLERSGKYIPLMKEILSQRGMPTDLVYLAMIESGFNVKAESRSAAVGPWQFIKPTALRYGLRVDVWVDERMDPRKSTAAAADYLSDLYAMFQSWELAAAGYNCGEDRVQAAIDKYQINDFWQISEYTLPEETKNYVPKLMAALIIAKNPEKYGFVGINYNDPEFYETVMVPPQKSLTDIAKVIGVSQYTLVELNPAILLNATPPGGPYQINVPQGYANIAARKSKELYALADVNPMIAQSSTGGTHTVKRGETLARIASRYGVSMSSIKKANGMRSSTVRTGQVLRIPGLAGPSTSYASADSAGTTVTYRIRRGDTLGAIAARHRVSIASIKNANNMRSSMIRTGEVLTIPGSTGRYYEDEEAVTNVTKIAKHKVQPGETLGGIAAKYNVSITTLQRANEMRSASIMAGEVLDIPYIAGSGSFVASSDTAYAAELDQSVVAAPAKSSATSARTTTRYTVKSGDTLGKIATSYGVSMSSIQSANNMSGTVVKRGQVLTIPGAAASSDAPVVTQQTTYNGSGTKYTVVRGDTLGSISRKFGVSVASIQNANNMNGSVVKYGQVLIIPGAAGASYAQKNTASSGTGKYKVQPGDTLGNIAAKYGVGVSTLMSANNLSGATIKSGQVLVIPGGSYAVADSSSAANDVISYRVKKGDTLWEIASRHNVSVASIQKWNNLTSAELRPGLNLTIYK